MAKLTIFVGLPGSGKSFKLDELKATHPSSGFIHDVFKGAHSDFLLKYTVHSGAIVRELRSGRDYFIADVSFTKTQIRKDFERDINQEVPGIELEWIYFENNLEQCLKNIAWRYRDREDNGEQQSKVENLAKKLSDEYAIPHGAAAIPVGKPSQLQ